jgi:dehydrogenase/reductase SDR family member 1
MGQQLEGRVAVVTGASRGIGKGIAVELGAHGATVYVTGRTTAEGGILPGTVGQTAQEIDELGGHGVALACDHRDDDAVAKVFEQVRAEQGRLDILVNNVFSSPDLAPWLGKNFWELPIEAWDQCIDIGVRSHYVAAALGVPLMLETGPGLIANISSAGAVAYSHNVPYGVGKAAVDRLSHDMAVELRPYGIGVVSLWPGIVATEMIVLGVPRTAEGRQILTLPGEGDFDLADADSPRFAGRAVAALFGAPDILERSGKAFHVADLAEAYGFTDIDGRIPRTHMSGRAQQRH